MPRRLTIPELYAKLSRQGATAARTRAIITADKLIKVLKTEVAKKWEEVKEARTEGAIAARPGEGYDTMKKLAADSMLRVEQMRPKGGAFVIKVGKYDILNQYRNPTGIPIWTFFEYGTYGATSNEWQFYPVKGAGIYGEGVSGAISRKNPHPHPPIPPWHILQYAYFEAVYMKQGTYEKWSWKTSLPYTPPELR